MYNVSAGDRKSKKIVKAFKYSFPAMGLFVASLLLKPASPDPNVQAPQNVLITGGYEPPERPSSDTD